MSGPTWQGSFAYPLTVHGLAYVPMNGTTHALHVAVGHESGGSKALATGVANCHSDAE